MYHCVCFPSFLIETRDVIPWLWPALGFGDRRPGRVEALAGCRDNKRFFLARVGEGLMLFRMSILVPHPSEEEYNQRAKAYKQGTYEISAIVFKPQGVVRKQLEKETCNGCEQKGQDHDENPKEANR